MEADDPRLIERQTGIDEDEQEILKDKWNRALRKRGMSDADIEHHMNLWWGEVARPYQAVPVDDGWETLLSDEDLGTNRLAAYFI